jgi:hypothetical protein
MRTGPRMHGLPLFVIRQKLPTAVLPTYSPVPAEPCPCTPTRTAWDCMASRSRGRSTRADPKTMRASGHAAASQHVPFPAGGYEQLIADRTARMLGRVRPGLSPEVHGSIGQGARIRNPRSPSRWGTARRGLEGTRWAFSCCTLDQWEQSLSGRLHRAPGAGELRSLPTLQTASTLSRSRGGYVSHTVRTRRPHRRRRSTLKSSRPTNASRTHSPQ